MFDPSLTFCDAKTGATKCRSTCVLWHCPISSLAREMLTQFVELFTSVLQPLFDFPRQRFGPLGLAFFPVNFQQPTG